VALTPAQATTLKHDIEIVHQAEFSDAVAAEDDQAIADAYNLAAVPAYTVWRSSVARATLLWTPGPQGTTFTFVDKGYITRTTQELMAFHELFDRNSDTMTPALPNVQDALDDIFSGPQEAAANLAHIRAHSQRHATRAERLYATGTGSTASPGTLTFEGILLAGDVGYALRGDLS
jgi:hypothetical protein